MPKKVLFFDYWTLGIHNFLPISVRLRSQGISSSLLHMGSWRDPEVPTTEDIGGILCTDIRTYANNLRNAILAEDPSVILMLNIGLVVDRTINRICRSLGIKTVFMMHGILPVGKDLDEAIGQGDKHCGPLRKLGKVPKYARLSAGYLAAIARNNSWELLAPNTYGHFLQYIISPTSVVMRPWPHQDIYCDLALVYANVYRDLLIRDVSYPPELVKVVGNPNLDTAFQLLGDKDAQDQAIHQLAAFGVLPGRKAVVYMEGGFVDRMSGWTEQTLLNELREIAVATVAADMDLVIKLHPGSNPSATLHEFVNHPQVHVVFKANLEQLVYACVATIGHVSTTLMFPIVLQRPLIVPTWSPGLERFSYYVGAGVAIPAASSVELSQILMNLDKISAQSGERLRHFVDNYITYTDGRSLDRIGHILDCVVS